MIGQGEFGSLLVHVLKIEREGMKRFDTWLVKVMEGLSRDKERREQMLIQIAYTCWIIWKEKCTFIFEKRTVNTQGIIERIRGAIREVSK